MLSPAFHIPLRYLEPRITERCSSCAYKFWLGLLETSLQYFPERGVFRYAWRVLDAQMLLTTHNAVTRWPIDDGDLRIRHFNELRELGLIERRESDGAYYIPAALHAVPVVPNSRLDKNAR